jgi:hypothetical protein
MSIATRPSRDRTAVRKSLKENNSDIHVKKLLMIASNDSPTTNFSINYVNTNIAMS